jgi:catechol 2,3-dioxygenase-like lactoylglutathione lyase family enzyme
MQLGAFSLSLAVKNLEASRIFYGKLGFEPVAGNAEHNYLILRNGTTTIGLFQGMFEKNSLTFNPGWDAQCNPLSAFTDVRELQKTLKASGIEPVQAADETTQGPAHCVLIDPDGNPILLDQHV